MVWREHRAVDARHRIERRVAERQVLGVALDEVDREPLRPGALATAFEQRRDVVGAGRAAAEPCGGDRCVAAAGRDVEDAPARVQIGGVDEALGGGDDRGRDLGEVAARPDGLLLGLDCLEVDGAHPGSPSVRFRRRLS